MSSAPVITLLDWRDIPAGTIPLLGGSLPITLGLGSALARRPGDPPGRVWALGDRGPNLKLRDAVADLRLPAFAGLDAPGSAKIMPRLDLGPTLCELQVEADAVRLLRTLPLRGPGGRQLTGVPPSHAIADEPAFDLDAQRIAPDPDGADTEGLVALSDGGFCVAEEYGPSLLWLDGEGQVVERWSPDFRLPPIARTRRLNRGFEALAVSPDESRLYVAFQSALETLGEPPDLVRIWTLDAASGELLAEHAYRFDPPASFRRDAAAGAVDASDLKVCDAACIAPSRLLVLERISASAKLYLVDLDAAGPLAKQLVFSSDEHPDVAPDLEGLAMLSPSELLLVTDNDFGVGGAATHFYKLTFETPLG